MVKDNPHAPLRYQRIAISSTFTDLKDHRAALIKAIKGNGLTDVAMGTTRPSPHYCGLILPSRWCGTARYIGVISRKYGRTPESPKLNPGGVSITELEFDEALRLNRPILLFIMGEEHKLTEADVELDIAKRRK